MNPRPLPVSRPASAAPLAPLLVAVLLLPAAARAARTYAPGEEVEIAGIVSDAEGRPLADLEVALTGYRQSFDIWSLKTEQRGHSTLTDVTDAKGAFSIRWRWDNFYNRFSISAGICREGVGETSWWRVAELDLTRAMKRGSPVVANLVVDDPEEVRSLQAFVASLESDDSRRVYQELGKPDKVQSVDLAGRRETTWWYFDRGMLYRFVDCRLDSSESFEPVPQLDSTEP